METKLTQRAMLSNLTIRMWGATLTDKKVTEEVATSHAVESDRAGRYRKYAINVKADAFRAARKAGGEMRVRHYWWTLPWCNEGARILPAANFDKYSAEMRKLRADFDRAVQQFVKKYPALKNAARRELNGLYNEADYPTDIASKFSVELEILPLPDASDFRVDLPQSAVEEIKQGITESMQRTTALAMRDPYQRLYDHISRMVDRLSDPEGRFHDTLVSGLVDLCAVLPGLNITNDTALEDLRRRAEKLVIGLDATTLRESPTKRSEIAKRAEEIQNMMAGFMGAQQ